MTLPADFERCPFLGCTSQKVMPYELTAEPAAGVFKPQTWFRVLCQCGVIGGAAPTEAGAIAHWNRRA